MKRTLALTLLFASALAAGQTPDANQEYCKYITEQAMAERDRLRTPMAIMGPIQPNTGLGAEIVFGVQNSLSDDLKAHLTMKLAGKTCSLYSATSEAQQHLLYALPVIEKDILEHRLKLIDSASSSLDSLIAVNMKNVESHNLTRQAIYALENAKLRLDTTRTATLMGISSPYVPPLSDTPLRTLVAAKMEAEREVQNASVALTKQNSWDFKLEAGAHRQLTQISSSVNPTGPYGAFTLSYNLGRHAIDKHLEKSADAYLKWKQSQFDDVAEEARILKQQIIESTHIQQDQLKALEARDTEIDRELHAIDGVDTNTALTYRNQLLADREILHVELEDLKFRVTQLEQYLAYNF
jgi:hypothetical protein